jgi:RNA polymerase sigma-B factor
VLADPVTHDVAALFRSLRVTGSPRVREELVRRHLPLARKLALRYHGGGEPLDDLVQVANTGLVKAVDRFDPERGHAFSSFAVPTILGELRRHFRDHAWQAHVPRGMQERVQALDQARARAGERDGRAPSVATLAREMGISEEEVLDALVARQAASASSLDAPAGPGQDDEAGTTLGALLGEADRRLELVDVVVSLRPAISALPALDREVLGLRFVEDLTQEEIGQRLGVSQMQVSRVLRRSLSRLRRVAEVHMA